MIRSACALVLALVVAPGAAGAAEAHAADAGPPGLVLHWTFAEMLGTKVEDSGPGNYDGRTFGSVRRGAGTSGRSLCFNSTNSGVSSVDMPNLLSNGFTFAAWVRWSEPHLPSGVLMQWGEGAPETAPITMLLDEKAEPQTTLRTASGEGVVRGLASFDDGGLWEHVAASWDGGSGRLTYYVDGEKWEGDRPGPIAPLLPGGRLWIGNDARQELGAKGVCIDDLRLYDRPLSQDEVIALAVQDNADMRPVAIRVTLDGTPTDARVTVLRHGDVFATVYTDLVDVGTAKLVLPAHAYDLHVSRGPGVTVPPKNIRLEVDAGREPLVVDAPLQRAFDPHAWGYYGADLHVHSAMSFDGGTPVRQLVGAELARDLDLAFLSDHDTIDGHAQFAEAAELRGVPYILGEELSDTGFGHFNFYPLTRLIPPGRLEGVTWDRYLAEARDAGAVRQVNHPFLNTAGYFNFWRRANFDRSFDTVEVFNADATPKGTLTREEIESWTVNGISHFWNDGEHYAAVAGSDQHSWIEPERPMGSAVTYVHVDGPLTAASFLAAVRAGHTFATYGPLVRFVAWSPVGRPAIPGDTLSVPAGGTVRFGVEVQSDSGSGEVELIRNGERVGVAPVEGRSMHWAPTEIASADAWYAVRVIRDGRFVTLTTPIWVRVEHGGGGEGTQRK